MGGCKIVCDKGISMLIIEASEIRGNVLYIISKENDIAYIQCVDPGESYTGGGTVIFKYYVEE